MTDPGGGQADLRPHLRSETIDEHATLIVRGGPNSVLTLQRHAHRTAQAFALDGVPVWGISVLAALEDLGPAQANPYHGGRRSRRR